MTVPHSWQQYDSLLRPINAAPDGGGSWSPLIVPVVMNFRDLATALDGLQNRSGTSATHQ